MGKIKKCEEKCKRWVFLLKLMKIPLFIDKKGDYFKCRENGARMPSGAVFFVCRRVRMCLDKIKFCQDM